VIKEFILRRKRGAERKEDFVKYFVRENIPESLALMVYHKIQSGCFFKDFPVKPDDNLYKIYGIVNEDVDDIVIETAEANNRIVPNVLENQKTVTTVEDVVRLVASFPMKV